MPVTSAIQREGVIPQSHSRGLLSSKLCREYTGFTQQKEKFRGAPSLYRCPLRTGSFNCLLSKKVKDLD